ncbi:hypothetical protein, partial [Halorhodospira neutriphila]
MQLQSTERGPLARIVGVVATIAVVALAATLGIVVLAVILGLALIGTVVVGLRAWWLRRQFRQASARAAEQRSGARGHRGSVIEGEFTRSNDERPPRSSDPG